MGRHYCVTSPSGRRWRLHKAAVRELWKANNPRGWRHWRSGGAGVWQLHKASTHPATPAASTLPAAPAASTLPALVRAVSTLPATATPAASALPATATPAGSVNFAPFPTEEAAFEFYTEVAGCVTARMQRTLCTLSFASQRATVQRINDPDTWQIAMEIHLDDISNDVQLLYRLQDVWNRRSMESLSQMGRDIREAVQLSLVPALFPIR